MTIARRWRHKANNRSLYTVDMTSALLIVALFAAHITPDANDVALKQSHLATNGKIVVLTYGAGNGVYFARSDDGGKTFSVPLKVAESGNLALGMHRGPRIAIVGKAIVVSAIIGEKGKGADGDLIAWRSTDGGNTWSSGARLNDVPAAAREGLHSIACRWQWYRLRSMVGFAR